jgi:uncharacterized protein YndB with AHSA1/START domain
MRRLLILIAIMVLTAGAGCARIKKVKKSIQEQISAMDISEGLNADSTLKGFELSAYLEASPSEVFEFCTRTAEFRKFFPGDGGGSFEDDPEVLLQPGDNLAFVFGDVPGFPSFNARMVVTRIRENRSLELFFVGPIWSRIEMYTEPEGTGTMLKFRNMYQIPEFVLDFLGVERTEDFVEAVAKSWSRKIRRLPSRMGLESSDIEPEVNFFDVLCNTHRTEAVINLPPDQVWERATRREFISGILGSFARIEGGSDTIGERGWTLSLMAPADEPVMRAQAVVVNAIPDQRLHLTLFLEDITGGAVAILLPENGTTRIKLMFYYEIPSDESMPPDLFMIFASAQQDIESFLSNLAECIEAELKE